MPESIVMATEVDEALRSGAPVVALESTIISHGLPHPRNLTMAREFETILRDAGVVPATIAVLDGVARIGVDQAQLERIADGSGMRKFSYRDLPLGLATGASGATTVSATAQLAARAGIRVFATGGLGGVHRGWVTDQDESADLDVLGRVRLTVVCAGVKSILDVPATLQRLETRNISVAGYQTDRFPGFYLRDSGHAVDWNLGSPADVAAAMRAQDTLDGPPTALVLANPVATQHQLEPALHDRVLSDGLRAAGEAGVRGQDVTPFLLSYLVEHTDGASLEANLAAVRGNIRLAADVSKAWCRQ